MIFSCFPSRLKFFVFVVTIFMFEYLVLAHTSPNTLPNLKSPPKNKTLKLKSSHYSLSKRHHNDKFTTATTLDDKLIQIYAISKLFEKHKNQLISVSEAFIETDLDHQLAHKVKSSTSIDEMQSYNVISVLLNGAISIMQEGNDLIVMGDTFQNSGTKLTIPPEKLTDKNKNLNDIAREIFKFGKFLIGIGNILVSSTNVTIEHENVDRNWIEAGMEIKKAAPLVYKAGRILGNITTSLGQLHAGAHSPVSDIVDEVFKNVRGWIHEKTCSDHIGCFSTGPPWSSIFKPGKTPQTAEEMNMKFILYTRKTPNGQYVSKTHHYSLVGSEYTGKKTTFFVFHGWQDNVRLPWLMAMKTAILKKVDANVIVVDWERGAADMDYTQVAANTRVVGAEAARLSKHMHREFRASRRKLHLVGFGFGAHACGHMAKIIQQVGRITALEPMQHLFSGRNKKTRLHKKDASFVQVIHTSGRRFIPYLGLGLIEPHGHVDYYINDGAYQPGCSKKIKLLNSYNLTYISQTVLSQLTPPVACHHNRAHEVFTASLDPNCTLWGYRADLTTSVTVPGVKDLYTYATSRKRGDCSEDSCSPVGLDNINYPARGIFVVKTSARPPFCEADPETDKKMLQYMEL